MGFQNRLCVYSPSVRQLYSNYSVFFPQEEGHKLVILPNPYAHHDTFQHINEESVKPTGLLVCPPRASDKGQRLTLLIPLKSDRSQVKRVPLNVGLFMINQKRAADRPFLPVLMKGDLRELDADTPCLHLHAIHLHLVTDISQLEKTDIQRVISQRLASLAGNPDKAY